MTWQAIIRQAAMTRFAKTGLCDPFRLARRELFALLHEVAPEFSLDDADQPGFVRVQVRVYVPELQMQIVVDEWEKG